MQNKLLLFSFLSFIGLWVSPAAQAQDNQWYRGEATIVFLDGSVRQTERILLSGSFVKVDKVFGGEKFPAYTVDHVELVTGGGEFNYFLPVRTQTGFFRREAYKWMFRDFVSNRIEMFREETTQVSYDAFSGFANTQRITTYYYRKDGGPIQLMEGQAVTLDVQDDPLAFALAEQGLKFQRVYKALNTTLYVGGGAFLVAFFVGQRISIEWLIGALVGVGIISVGQVVVNVKAREKLLEALQMYE